MTKPNDDWLKDMVDSEEYASKSEVVNDLIRQAREIDTIRAKLAAGNTAAFRRWTRTAPATRSGPG